VSLRSLCPHECYRTKQPLRRIGTVIGLLRRFDVVEKGSIYNRLPRGGDRGKQDRSARRVRTGNRITPLLQPVRARGADGGARNSIKKGRLIQQGMPHAAVTPVEQCQGLPIAAKIPGVEIAMDQRVSNTASGHIVEPAGKPAYKMRERCVILGGYFVARALDIFGDRSRRTRRAF